MSSLLLLKQKMIDRSHAIRWWLVIVFTVVSLFSVTGCEDFMQLTSEQQHATEHLPTEYDGFYQELVINDNQPVFDTDELTTANGVWQSFSDLDVLNRVGVANALIGQESFPTDDRVSRLYVKPTGWNQKKTGNGQNDWLYNRSHLIAFRLTGENDNPKNLMTGTRQFNDPHMKNYETQIADYIYSTGNHVRYRVTPHFIDKELVARGIQLEAQSVESSDFSFNIYIFNIQDNYTIDYLTGKATKLKNNG